MKISDKAQYHLSVNSKIKFSTGVQLRTGAMFNSLQPTRRVPRGVQLELHRRMYVHLVPGQIICPLNPVCVCVSMCVCVKSRPGLCKFNAASNYLGRQGPAYAFAIRTCDGNCKTRGGGEGREGKKLHSRDGEGLSGKWRPWMSEVIYLHTAPNTTAT